MKKSNRPEQRKYHYIYKITRDDGKYYIGLHSTDNLDDGYFGSGERLWKSINYHGKEKHTKTILEMFNSRADLIAREKELVTKQIIESDGNILNLVPGGSYFTRRPDKAEGNKNKSEALKKFYASGSDASLEARQKVSEANTGKAISDAHKEILSITLSNTIARLKETGEWAAVVQKNRDAHIGKVQSEETKSKRVVSIKKTKDEKYGGKYIFSEQACKNISQSQLGNEKHAKTWSISLNTGEVFQVRNIAKWYRETGIIHRKDGVTLKNGTGEVIGTRTKVAV
jgi:hypothetical protein